MKDIDGVLVIKWTCPECANANIVDYAREEDKEYDECELCGERVNVFVEW